MRDFQLPGRSAVFAQNGMCATSHPLAAAEAIAVLKDGGNAMDAAIAGAVLLGICEPQMTGIGGDCFVLFTPPGSDEVRALNGSGRAPAGIDANALRARGHDRMPEDGALSVTIPGAIDAFCRLSEDWGKIGLERILAPAIHYAETGVPIAPRVAADLEHVTAALTGPGIRHYSKDGAPLALGEIFRAPGQAEVLHRVAREGRSAFYEGEVAEDMVATLADAGGSHALADFAGTACDFVDPISGIYKGTELIEHPPNGQGATAILMANILKRFDLSALDPFGADRAHLEAEAATLAYDARNRFVADPDHTARLDHMLSQATADRLAALIDPQRATARLTELAEVVHKDTIYITVVDRDRMKVSLIYSIFSGFGSGLASEKFGILFQNRGAGFNLIPGHPNEAGPGKRPMHTIIPGMLAQGGKVTLPFGVMGGGYQPQGHVRFLTNLVDFGMDPQSAIDGPRLFHAGGELRVEHGYAPKVLADLAARGHNVADPGKPIGGAQAIRLRDDGVLEGASDPRKDGIALGY